MEVSCDLTSFCFTPCLIIFFYSSIARFCTVSESSSGGIVGKTSSLGSAAGCKIEEVYIAI